VSSLFKEIEEERLEWFDLPEWGIPAEEYYRMFGFEYTVCENLDRHFDVETWLTCPRKCDKPPTECRRCENKVEIVG